MQANITNRPFRFTKLPHDFKIYNIIQQTKKAIKYFLYDSDNKHLLDDLKSKVLYHCDSSQFY